MRNDWKDDELPQWLDPDLDWPDEYKTESAPAQPEPPKSQAPRKETPRPAPRAAQRQQPVRRAARPAEEPVRRATPASERPQRQVSPQPRDTRESYESARQKSRRSGGGTNKLLIVLIVVLGLGMIFAGWRLASFLLNYHRDRSAYNDLAGAATIVLAAEETEDTGETTVSGVGGERVVSEIPLSVDWEYLRGINSSIVGWLYCPDTIINYPVVQSEDHEYYLDHGFDGNSNTSGTLFADMNSVLGIEQSNYITYGHNMKDESMFGTFKNYVDKSYYNAHPVLYYLTPNGSYRVDLICAHIVESTYDNFPGYFSTIADYQSYINQIAAEAFWVNYDAITTEHQLMTLSTCTSASGYDDARFVLHGMMVPIQ